MIEKEKVLNYLKHKKHVLELVKDLYAKEGNVKDVKFAEGEIFFIDVMIADLLGGWVEIEQ